MPARGRENPYPLASLTHRGFRGWFTQPGGQPSAGARSAEGFSWPAVPTAPPPSRLPPGRMSYLRPWSRLPGSVLDAQRGTTLKEGSEQLVLQSPRAGMTMLISPLRQRLRLLLKVARRCLALCKLFVAPNLPIRQARSGGGPHEARRPGAQTAGAPAYRPRARAAALLSAARRPCNPQPFVKGRKLFVSLSPPWFFIFSASPPTQRPGATGPWRWPWPGRRFCRSPPSAPPGSRTSAPAG